MNDRDKNIFLLQDQFPYLSVYQVFHRFYPYGLFLNQAGQTAVENILNTYDVAMRPEKKSESLNKIINVKKENGLANVQIDVDGSFTNASVR